MAVLKNEFSWSWSRHRAFETCRRRYWLNHYGFWGGWTSRSPAREIYIQKKLNSRPQWLGTMVHQAAEWLLGEVRRGSYPTPERAIERTMRQARRMIEDSERGAYRSEPKRKPGFIEHYYAETVEPQVWEQDLSEIERQVRNLFDNPVFLRLTSVSDRIVEVEELNQVTLGGVPVWVSLDVLVRSEDDSLVIIDWKTGRSHNAETVANQLGVYGAYVLDRYLQVPIDGPLHVPAGRVKSMYVNLRDGEFETRTLDEGVVEATRERIAVSAAAMRALLHDQDENIAREQDFPMLPEGDPECQRCVFRRTCGRD